MSMSSCGEWMLDRMDITMGPEDDIDSLNYAAGLLDKHTKVRQIEFADMDVCHYIGEENGKLQFIALSEDGRLKTQLHGDKFILTAGSPMAIPKDAENGKLVKLLEEIVFDQDSHGTLFRNQEMEDAPYIFFTSSASRKTLPNKLCPGGYVCSSLERDLMLRRYLYEQVTMPLYTVYRECGDYGKIISLFSKEPHRIPFQSLTGYLKNTEGVETISANIRQDTGIKVKVVLTSERKAYGAARYVPYRILQISDAGYISDRISIGWYPAGHPEAGFLTKVFPVKGDDIGKVMQESTDWIASDYATLLDNGLFLPGNLGKCVDQITRNSGLTKVSVKSASVLKDVIMHYQMPIRTKGDLIGIMTDTLIENLYHGISVYADKLIREQVMGNMIAEVSKL